TTTTTTTTTTPAPAPAAPTTTTAPAATAPATTTAPPSATTAASLYALVDGIPAAGLGSANGAGVGIAVIDSGVAPVPDLGTRVTQIAIPGQTGGLDDSFGHGTFVTGIAA